MATETARTIQFSCRRISFQQLDAQSTTGLSLGVPIVVDTHQEVELKVTVTLESIRGGSYLYPLSVEPKEISSDLSGKLTDCPPALAALFTGSAYTTNSVQGPAIDSVTNIVGSSVSSRLTVTITSGQKPVSGMYALVATAANTYAVYDMQSGAKGNTVTTSASITTTDTTSIPGVTISTAAGTFTAGDTANIEVVNIGASGSPTDNVMETVSGNGGSPGLVLPHARITGDAVTDGVLYSFTMARAKLQGTTYPMGQGKFVVPSFGAMARVPVGGGVPIVIRRIP